MKSNANLMSSQYFKFVTHLSNKHHLQVHIIPDNWEWQMLLARGMNATQWPFKHLF